MNKNIHQTCRSLLRKPTSTITPILVLALAIGATTAIFNILDAALLRPLQGVSRPSELVLFQRVQDGQVLGNLGYPDYLDYRQQTRLLTGVAASGRASVNYTHGEVTERTTGAVVSGNYFSVLGIEAAVGRMLAPEDESGKLENAVISYRLWQRDFGGQPSVLGRAIELNGHPFTVIGVVPGTFVGTTIGAFTDIWVPVTTQPIALPYMSAGILKNRAAGWLTLFGRLRSGVRIEQAQGEIANIGSGLAAAFPNTNGQRTVRLFSGLGMDPDTKDRLARFLILLLSSVFLLLLIACGNVSSLLLTRAASKRREIAVRLALGAGRSHLVIQLVTEAFAIATVACCLALMVASEVSPLVVSWERNYGLQSLNVSLDWRAFAFAASSALVTAVLCSLAPMWHTNKLDLSSALKQGSAGAGQRTAMFRNILVVLQVTLSVVLLVAAGLVIRTVHHVLTTNEGFETRQIALVPMDLTTSGYTPERGRVFYDQLLERVKSIPGVVSASLASTVPPSETSGRQAIFYPGQQPENIQGHEFDPSNLRVDTNTVGPDYFRTMRIALLHGREFTAQDREKTSLVAIINDRLAEQLWPGQDAVGKRLAVPEFSGIADPNVEIIGVSRSTKHRSLLQGPEPVLYLPILQRYGGRTTLVIRTAANDPASIVPEVTRQLRSLDRTIPLSGIETMPEHIGISLWQEQIAASLIGLFGMFAVVLASVGLYGIVSNNVTERTREIGIRLALGSQTFNIRGIILKQSLSLVFIGMSLGIALSLALTRFLSTLLYEISPHDVLTFTSVCLVLGIVTLIASEIPTRRALHIDPATALRQE